MVSMLNLRTMYRLRRLFKVMLPVLASQISIIGMNFFDAAMSGHAGAEQLAGSSIGGSLMMPIIASSMGILMAATPIIAHLVGQKDTSKVGLVVQTGLLLAAGIEVILLVGYFLGIDSLLVFLALEPDVAYIARYYMLAVIIGLSGGLLTFPLRSLTDTVAGTALSMKIYMSALPINALLNYVFIFGALGVPAMGGVGAGIATGMTYYVLLVMFITVIAASRSFGHIGLLRFSFSWHRVKEYLGIGVPNGLAIFMEASLFGFIIVFISKFGTDYIAAHQAAMSFSSVLYMLPLSFSMALTIIIGIEAGARRHREARIYSRLGLGVAFSLALMMVVLVWLNRDLIARLYATEPILLAYIPHFLLYTAAWQLFDAVACPIQGILRGYKDVKAAFYISMLAYWGICMPLGIFLDYVMAQGAFAYWQSMVLGIFTSAVLLVFRLRWIESKFK